MDVLHSNLSIKLASAGEDRVIHVWEVQECDLMSSPPERLPLVEAPIPLEKKKKGKVSSGSRKRNSIPEYVHVPETVFSISEKPVCSFTGHLDDVLDLSWSKSQVSSPILSLTDKWWTGLIFMRWSLLLAIPQMARLAV